MTRYHIDRRDGGGWVRDVVGQKLPDRDAARKAALQVLPDMARDELPDGDRREFVVVVREGDGRLLFQATLALTARWLG